MDPFNKNKDILREKIKKLRSGKLKLRLVVVNDDDATREKITSEKPQDITETTKTHEMVKSDEKPTSNIGLDDKDETIEITTKKIVETPTSIPIKTKSITSNMSIPIKSKDRTASKSKTISMDKIQSFNDSIEKRDHKHTDIDFYPELIKDFDTIDDIVNSDSGKNKFYIYNVYYTIVYNAMKPYLMYYTYKFPKSSDPSSETLFFPYERYKYNPDKSNSISKQSKSLINKTMSSKIRDAIETTSKGYIYNEKTRQIFVIYEYDSIKRPIEIQKLTRDKQFWWGLIDELVNYKQLLNFKVSPIVTNLLLSNPSLLYLHNRETNEQIETPGVGYHGTLYQLLPLIINFGLKSSTLYPMMGKFFYFGTFRKAVRYAGWTSTYKPRKLKDVIVADDHGLYQRGGIVRFALFLGDMKAFLNNPNDPQDLSERYYMRITSNPRDKEYEDMKLKLHDHEGKWSDKYDSVYVGRARLSNGGIFMKNPEFVTKTFEQQTILSYHELDKKSLYYNDKKKKYEWNPEYKGYNIV